MPAPLRSGGEAWKSCIRGVRGLDVHARCVNACVRIAAGRKATTEHREFATTTAGLLDLAAWLTEASCTHVAMEATGVYWKPVWHILEDEESLTPVLANPLHIRNVPGRKSDRKDAAWIADLGYFAEREHRSRRT